MAKKINYPTDEYIDRWIDNFLDSHPDTKVSDFQELRNKAEDAWWINEIDHDRPTPFDLTEEQEKNSKEARKGMARREVTEKREIKRVRKPNDSKQWVINNVKTLFEGLELNGKCEKVEVTNPERTIDFYIGEKHYTLTLTEHRAKKEAGKG